MAVGVSLRHPRTPSGPMTVVRLRFAVATAGPILAWQAECITALAEVPGVSIEHWTRVPAGLEPRTPGHGPLAQVPVPEAISRLEVGPVAPTQDPAETGGVDVLLDLTSGDQAYPVGGSAEVWYFGYGPSRLRDATHGASIDLIRTPGRSYVVLLAEPGRRVVREGWISWLRGEQLERVLADPSTWPAAAALDRIDRVGPGDSIATIDRTMADRISTELPGQPDRLASMPGSVLRVAALGNRILHAPGAFTRHDDWSIGIAETRIEDFLIHDRPPAVTWLPRRSGHFAADPFGIERDGVLHVLFEDYDQRRGYGSIAHIAISEDGTRSDPEIVLDPGVHASYPYLLEHDGAVFMLPETSAARGLVLYQAVEFPNRWRPALDLLPGIPAVDASVVLHEGTWWMFATRRDRGPNNNLFLWHSKAPTGPWIAHDANPVKTDARSARPGGTPFTVDGQLYRPAQDDSGSYGGGLVINRVDVLTPRHFEERPIKRLGPRPGSPARDGFHTLAAAGRRTLVDGNVRHLVPATLGLLVSQKLARVRPHVAR